MTSRIDQIYREGTRLFAQKGVEATSIRDVAKACGVSMAAIYYHFATKEELHDEVTQLCFEEFISQIMTKKKKLPANQQKPSSLLALIFDAVMEDSTLFFLLQRDMQHLCEDERRARYRKRQAEFATLIRDTMHKAWGKQPDETAVMSALGFVAGFCEVLQADSRLSGPDKEQFISHNRKALVRMVEQSFDRPVLF